MNDLKFACRQLLKNPGFTAVAVLTLALGVGANLAVFARFNVMLLKPPPVAHPEELWDIRPSDTSGEPRGFNFSKYYYDAIREHPGAFKRVVGLASDLARLRGRGYFEDVDLSLVSWDYFEFVGTQPLMGRAFVREDERTGAVPVTVVSHSFWMQHFDGDPAVLGRTVELNGKLVEVVGVMPPDFRGMHGSGRSPQLWLPASLAGSFYIVSAHFRLVGRLDTSVESRRAEDSLAAVVSGVTKKLTAEALPVYSSNISGFTRVALRFAGRGEVSTWIDTSPLYQTYELAVLGTSLVLVVTLLNLAGLSLARVVRRQKEIATRIALGATRWCIVRQVLLEGLVLTATGTLIAACLLNWLGRVLPVMMPATFSASVDLPLDVRVWVAAAVLALLGGVLFAALPAWYATRIEPIGALKVTGGTDCGAGGWMRWFRPLMLFQIAGSFALLSCVAICASAINRQIRTDVGFDHEQVMLANVDLLLSDITEPDAATKVAAVRQRLASLPGIEAVGWLDGLPFTDFGQLTSSGNPNWIPGYESPEGVRISVSIAHLGPDVFRALGVPVLQGSEFADPDFTRPTLMALVNESFVKKYWPDQPALGKIITLRRTDHYRVVGVVPDVRLMGPVEQPAGPTIYFTHNHPKTAPLRPTLVIRAARNPEGFYPLISGVFTAEGVKPESIRLRRFEEIIGASLANEQRALSFTRWLAATATGLAVLGIFGTMSHTVSRRTREFGVRFAVGARRTDILMQVLKLGIRSGIAGVLIGLPLAWWGALLLKQSQYEVSSPMTGPLLTAGIVVLVSAMVACLVPALRAAKTDPMEALRAE